MDWWHWTDGSLKHYNNKYIRYLKDSDDEYYLYFYYLK